MKYRIYVVIFIIFLLTSCNCNKKYFYSKTISENLYLEVYNCPGGVYASDYYYYYVTDSIKFREFVGKRDENGAISLINI